MTLLIRRLANQFIVSFDVVGKAPLPTPIKSETGKRLLAPIVVGTWRRGTGIKESRRDHCASLGSRSREDMCNDLSPARADFRRVHDEGTTPAGSMPWLETDFRHRYNHAVPTDRVSAEVPLSGELVRQEVSAKGPRSQERDVHYDRPGQFRTLIHAFNRRRQRGFQGTGFPRPRRRPIIADRKPKSRPCPGGHKSIGQRVAEIFGKS
jgi:hypothetical protein